MSVYPKNETLPDGSVYPGVDASGKFTDGDASKGVKASHLPAATVNLLLDNLADFITASGLTPNNTGTDQLRKAFHATFPVGTIWMYDGANWRDNVTLPGWYACVPENEDGGAAGLNYGLTSMVDRFVMGRSAVGAGETGGANSYRLTAAQLPAHTHTINHDHPSSLSGNQRQNHRHHLAINSNTTGSHVHSLYGRYTSGVYPTGRAIHNMTTGMRDHFGDVVGANGNHTHHTSGWTGWISASHNHDVDIPAFTGNSGATGLGAAVDNRPAFYSMIFIRKCV